MKPMLAVNIDPAVIRFPVFASPKLDGVRGIVVDGQLRSRSLKPIPNLYVTGLFSQPYLNGYDGELIVGDPTARDAFRVTGSATSRQEGTPEVTFYVFDNYLAPGGFEQRLASLHASFCVVVLEQHLVHSLDELITYEEQCLTAGYEGLILRDPAGAYKFGRSTAREQGMMKLKRFHDSEAEILGVVEEMENTNEKTTNELGRGHRSHHLAGMVPKGRAGALQVRDLTTGVEFQIGTGMNDADRAWFWEHRGEAVGKVVKYKSFAIGVKTAPRFPVYLGGRETWDMEAK